LVVAMVVVVVVLMMVVVVVAAAAAAATAAVAVLVFVVVTDGRKEEAEEQRGAAATSLPWAGRSQVQLAGKKPTRLTRRLPKRNREAMETAAVAVANKRAVINWLLRRRYGHHRCRQ
jgi:hypothetical protein